MRRVTVVADKDARLLDGDRAEASEDVSVRVRAVADDLSATIGVSDVCMYVDPISDFGLNGSGEHFPGSLAKNLAEDVAAVG